MEAWIVPIVTIILSIVLPFVVNLVKNQNWSETTKRWIAIVFSLIAGVATAFMSGVPTPETFVTWSLAVVGGVQIAYAAFKAIGVTSSWLDALEGVGAKKETVSK